MVAHNSAYSTLKAFIGKFQQPWKHIPSVLWDSFSTACMAAFCFPGAFMFVSDCLPYGALFAFCILTFMQILELPRK